MRNVVIAAVALAALAGSASSRANMTGAPLAAQMNIRL